LYERSTTKGYQKIRNPTKVWEKRQFYCQASQQFAWREEKIMGFGSGIYRTYGRAYGHPPAAKRRTRKFLRKKREEIPGPSIDSLRKK
jgi:hypothetical protein